MLQGASHCNMEVARWWVDQRSGTAGGGRGPKVRSPNCRTSFIDKEASEIIVTGLSMTLPQRCPSYSMFNFIIFSINIWEFNVS